MGAEDDGRKPAPETAVPRSRGWIWFVVVVFVLAAAAMLAYHPPWRVPCPPIPPRESCLRNEKQLALAFLMYAQDYDEHLPVMSGWPQAVYPYLMNAQIYTCPSDSHPTRVAGVHWSEGGGLSYAMWAGLPNRALSDSRDPGRKVLLLESDLVPVASLTDVAWRHREDDSTEANFAFADGHAKSFTAGGAIEGFAEASTARKPKGR